MRFTCCNSRGAFNKKLLASFLEAGKKSPLNSADFFLLVSQKLIIKPLRKKKNTKRNTKTSHFSTSTAHLNHVEAMEDGKMTVEQHEERKGTPSFPAWSPRIFSHFQLDIWEEVMKNLEKHNKELGHCQLLKKNILKLLTYIYI